MLRGWNVGKESDGVCIVHGCTHLCYMRRWIGKVWPGGGEGEWSATQLAAGNSISDSENSMFKGRRVPTVFKESWGGLRSRESCIRYQVILDITDHGEEFVFYFAWDGKLLEVCEQDIDACKTLKTPHNKYKTNKQTKLAFILASLEFEGNLHSAL